MDHSVFKLVLFFRVEDDALLVHEVEDADFPQGTIEKLDQELILPFLDLANALHPRITPQLETSSGAWAFPPSAPLSSFQKATPACLINIYGPYLINTNLHTQQSPLSMPIEGNIFINYSKSLFTHEQSFYASFALPASQPIHGV